MPEIASRLSSLDMAAPLASAASFIQLERQLRQKPARFIKSMFCTSVRKRKCPTRRRNAAASSSVLVFSSMAMTATFQSRDLPLGQPGDCAGTQGLYDKLDRREILKIPA